MRGEFQAPIETQTLMTDKLSVCPKTSNAVITFICTVEQMLFATPCILLVIR